MTDAEGPNREDPLDAVERAVGHAFRDRRLLIQALTHPSLSGSDIEDNQTLEFLGDGLLNFLVAELLFHALPLEGEGTLSKARSLLVSRRHFAALGRSLGLGQALFLPPTIANANVRERDSAVADAFEAVFAALFLDGGFDAARAAARRLFAEDIGAIDPATLTGRDPKTALQERATANDVSLLYTLLEETGPSHDRHFVYEVAYGSGLRAQGGGKTKKEAQQNAARTLLERLSGSGPL